MSTILKLMMSQAIWYNGIEHDFANLAHGCVHHARPFFWFLLRDVQDIHVMR